MVTKAGRIVTTETRIMWKNRDGGGGVVEGKVGSGNKQWEIC